MADRDDAELPGRPADGVPDPAEDGRGQARCVGLRRRLVRGVDLVRGELVPRCRAAAVVGARGVVGQAGGVRRPRALPARPRRRPPSSWSGDGSSSEASSRRPYPDHVLTLDRATYDGIVAHAKRDHPTRRAASSPAPRAPTARNGWSSWRTPPAVDLLRVRRRRPAPPVPRDGRPRRGAGRGLSLAPATEAYPVAPTSGSRWSHTPTTCWSPPEPGNNDGPVELSSYRIMDVRWPRKTSPWSTPYPPDPPTTPRSKRPRWPLRSGSPDPAPLHRRPEVRRGQRRQPERPDRRPRVEPPRHQGTTDRGQGRRGRPAPLRQRLRQR